MDPGAPAPGSPKPDPPPSTPTPPPPPQEQQPSSSSVSQQPPSRYESQKRRDWNTFLQYLKNHKPPLTLERCSGAHVIEFLKYLDQYGKTKVHVEGCTYFGHANPPAPCTCPLKQAWGSLDALIGRLRAAYEESGGKPETNPFGARPVRIYLREVKEGQAKARGIQHERRKRKRTDAASSTSSAAVEESESRVEGSIAGGEEGGEPTPAPPSTTLVSTTITTSTSTA